MQPAHAKIPLISSTFHKEEDTKVKLVEFIKRSPKLSMGDYCARFENKFSYWQGRKHSVLVNSGSSANLALLQTLLNLGKLKRGDSVGFSALTWATNAMPIIQLGLKPCPIDVEMSTLNISTQTLADSQKKRLKAVFVTNLLGLCHDLDEIADYCVARNIILIEDNCESMGSEYMEKKLGNFGLASTFSFYVGHQMSTIEGGMIATDDEELANMLKMVRAHGWKRDTADYTNDFYGRYTFYDLGYNLRPTEITGFLGVNQLDYIDAIVKKRQDNFNIIREVYSQSGVFSYETDHMDKFASFAFPIVAKTKEKRDKMLEKADQYLETRPIVGGNITEQPFFIKYVGEYEMPNASLIHQNGFYVGNNPDLDHLQLNIIKEALT